jgi:hypothetical protein
MYSRRRQIKVRMRRNGLGSIRGLRSRWMISKGRLRGLKDMIEKIR